MATLDAQQNVMSTKCLFPLSHSLLDQELCRFCEKKITICDSN